MADAADSKSAEGNLVGVRLPPPAPLKYKALTTTGCEVMLLMSRTAGTGPVLTGAATRTLMRRRAKRSGLARDGRQSGGSRPPAGLSRWSQSSTAMDDAVSLNCASVVFAPSSLPSGSIFVCQPVAAGLPLRPHKADGGVDCTTQHAKTFTNAFCQP